MMFAMMDGVELQWLIDPTVDMVALFDTTWTTRSSAGRSVDPQSVTATMDTLLRNGTSCSPRREPSNLAAEPQDLQDRKTLR